MEQILEKEQKDDFIDRLERAKQIYYVLNKISFGNETDSKKSRVILKKIA